MQNQNIKYLIYSFVISILIIFIFKSLSKKNKKIPLIDTILYSILLTFIFFILFTKFLKKQENFTEFLNDESEEMDIEEEMRHSEEEMHHSEEEMHHSEEEMHHSEEEMRHSEEEMRHSEEEMNPEEEFKDNKKLLVEEENNNRPDIFKKTIDNDSYVKGPININVSYKSAINDSYLAKDDISVISRNKLNSERQFDNKNETQSYPPPQPQYNMNNAWSNNYPPPPPKIYVPPTESSYNPNVVKVPKKRVIVPPVAGVNHKGKKEPCPVMVNKPWSDYLSGDYK